MEININIDNKSELLMSLWVSAISGFQEKCVIPTVNCLYVGCVEAHTKSTI